MTNSKGGLTASNIKYLLAMYRLYSECRSIRCVRIAEALHITKPSVHTMLNTLQKLKLVSKNYRSEVYLTDEGLKIAERYSTYYNALHSMFSKVLIDESEIHSVVCTVIAEISEESLLKLCERQAALKISSKDARKESL